MAEVSRIGTLWLQEITNPFRHWAMRPSGDQRRVGYQVLVYILGLNTFGLDYLEVSD